MAARRKLFLTHAGELAHHLVSAIARDAMAMEFVRAYAERHDRRKVVANAERLREMETTIGREALLLIAADVRRLLPRAFGFSGNPRPEELSLCDTFYTEFLEALGRALEWPRVEAGSEAEAFRRDLEIYTSWRGRNRTHPARRKESGTDSPFPDRCAILLDSAMMEQARRAAGKFQADLRIASVEVELCDPILLEELDEFPEILHVLWFHSFLNFLASASAISSVRKKIKVR